MSWREALPEPPGLAGSVVLNSRNESEEVKDIVENVTRLVDMTDLYVADNPVGVKSRIPDIQSNDMIPLVLWGAWAELSPYSRRENIAEYVCQRVWWFFPDDSYADWLTFSSKEALTISLEDEEGTRVISSIESGNKVEVAVFENGFIMKKTVYLVYDNECIGKRISTQEEQTDYINQNRKKKNQVE
ncbi:disease resistance protein RPV1 [Trifolium repens]|nr:disease resistance protein RPV1 [Trifolium repens]